MAVQQLMTEHNIDYKRCFRNKAAEEEVKEQCSGSGSLQQWDSRTDYTNVARLLMTKCLEHYEEGLNMNDDVDDKGTSGIPRSSRLAAVAASSSKSSSRSMGTLYCGALGPRAYLRLRMAQHLQSFGHQQLEKMEHEVILELQQEALKVTQKAVQIETEQYSRQRRTPRVSLLESSYVGSKALLAALYQHVGEFQKAQQEALELLNFLSKSQAVMEGTECEVLYGRAGAMQAILFLRRELHQETLGSAELVVLAKDIILQGLRIANENNKNTTSLPLLWQWHDKTYLGAAHGIVGILHTLLCLSPSEFQQVDDHLITQDRHFQRAALSSSFDMIRETICGLNDTCCWPSGNLKSSIPTSSSSKDKLVHWCHGAPGHVLLLVKAYEVYQDESFLERARIIGRDVIWPRGLLRKGVGLCHGISGNAYSMLSLARPLLDKKDDTMKCWMQRVHHFVAFAFDNLSSSLEDVPDHPYSLFEGIGGLVLLLMDLAEVQHYYYETRDEDSHETLRRSIGRFPLYDF